MITDTMPQLAQAERVGWNLITANLYGVPAFFSGDTPISAIQATLRAYANSLMPTQGQAPWRPGDPVPAGCEVVTMRGRQVLRCPDRQQAPDILGAPGRGQAPDPVTGPVPDLRDMYPSIPLPPRDAGSATAPGTDIGEQKPGEVSCSPWDLECIAGKVIGSEPVKDLGKRAVLLVFALALLVVAIISLR